MGENRQLRNARQREYMRARRAAGIAVPKYVTRVCGCGIEIRIRSDKSTTRCGSCSRRASALSPASIASARVTAKFAGAVKAQRRAERLLPVPFGSRRGIVPVHVVRSRRCWYAGYCRRCAAPFVTDQPNTEACSERCIRADKRDRRRARKHGARREPIYRAAIFARDLWRCMLCGEPLAMAEQVPHPLAPTIDHVIPLARGGWHAPDNVQAAHFLCNSRKSDRLQEVA